MTAHHNGQHPHHRADAPTVSHHQHDRHTGHDKHAGHAVEMFRQKFWGTLLLSVPTIVWAPMIQEWFGYEAPGGPSASRWIAALFGHSCSATAAGCSSVVVAINAQLLRGARL